MLGCWDVGCGEQREKERDVRVIKERERAEDSNQRGMGRQTQGVKKKRKTIATVRRRGGLFVF